jgi:hypothetical protein
MLRLMTSSYFGNQLIKCLSNLQAGRDQIRQYDHAEGYIFVQQAFLYT